jgi:predicted dehydrogenase
MALKVGFIGVGGIARRHLENARKREDIAMVAFCDVVPERARKCAEEFNGNAYENFVELYDKEKPDAVIICTPPFAHGDIEEEAARRGIHFFVEKPVAVNMETANRIARIVEETGIITQVGYMYRTCRGNQEGARAPIHACHRHGAGALLHARASLSRMVAEDGVGRRAAR